MTGDEAFPLPVIFIGAMTYRDMDFSLPHEMSSRQELRRMVTLNSWN